MHLAWIRHSQNYKQSVARHSYQCHHISDVLRSSQVLPTDSSHIRTQTTILTAFSRLPFVSP